MPEMDGLELLKTIKQPPSVIITTAFRNYAPEAFDLDVIDYLLKPIAFERLIKAVNKFFDREALPSKEALSLQEQKECIYLKEDGKVHQIYIEQILYIESLDEFVRVHLQDGVFTTTENISKLQRKLSSDAFIRIHRSFLVSIKAITCITTEWVEIKGIKKLPFGRTFKQLALARIGYKV